jgi:activin receptor type-1
MTSRNSITQLWLVTHYHPLGSLYDHLNRHSLTHLQLLHLAISAISGLLHLHTEIFGTQVSQFCLQIWSKDRFLTFFFVTGKTGHRPPRHQEQEHPCSVKWNFGLAVTHTQTTGEMNVANNPRVGTKRYMSPEVLDQT